FSDISKIANPMVPPQKLQEKSYTLSNMNPTSTSQTQSLLSALKTNPIPNMSDQQSSTQSYENETSQDN
ncbi:26170_t:CDS:1, partial [Gigaspora margarita]